MKRLLTLTFRVNEQDMFYSYPVQEKSIGWIGTGGIGRIWEAAAQ